MLHVFNAGATRLSWQKFSKQCFIDDYFNAFTITFYFIDAGRKSQVLTLSEEKIWLSKHIDIFERLT